MKSLLLNTYPEWVTNSFPVIRIIFMAIIGLCALGMIVVTLLQSTDAEGGTNVITGTKNESYFSQNKGGTKDEKLKRATIALAIIITSCVVLYFITFVIYPGA